MHSTKSSRIFAAAVIVSLACARLALAQTPPPAPVLVAPANGASVAQPVTLDWNAVTDPDGPIGSYTWQVATSTAFSSIVLSGFTNNLSDSIPTATADKVSGLPNGTYFWRVKATQIVGGATFAIDSPWSAVRSFNVTGLGPAPGTPSITSPATGTSFHVREFFDIKWTAVPGAHYYVLEADDQPSFSHPLTLTTDPITFGTKFNAGWGNAISNIYYRVRAVSADNVRGLPSATLNVHITNGAPVPSAPQLVAPAASATVSLPFTFDWTDTANPQVPGYDLDVDTDPNFSGSFGALLVQGITRSDYMLASDLAPGNYFWRVRALHGDVAGPWSPGRAIRVVAAPAPPPDSSLFAIIAEPGNAYGGNSTQARIFLNQPAPAGGARVTIASDMPQAQAPGSIIVPAGKTDGSVTITSGPVPSNGIIGTVRAAYAGGWQQSSLGVLPILYGVGLGNEAVIGGATVTGSVVLQSAAPAGGTTVRLISSDTSLARPPATVTIPAGATDASFSMPTSAISVPTRVVISSGTDVDGYRAPDAWLLLNPAGTPAPAASLSSITFDQPAMTGGGTMSGTLTLTSPAPAGGASVWMNGSMEGQVITPPTVTVPAGSTSARFTLTAPQVATTRWVVVQARYGTSGGSQARTIRIDPGPPGPATLLAMNATTDQIVGGNSLRGTVALAVPAPPGGGAVSLASDNPGVAQVPASVGILEGNSTNSFTITTSPVTVAQFVRITASAGGVTRDWGLDVTPDPNAPPLLQSLAISPASVAGGTNATGTVTLRAPAPSGGVGVTLSTSNLSVARPPGAVTVPGGQTSASFTITTFAVSSSTTATITASFDAARAATLTVTAGAPAAATLSAVSLNPGSVTSGATSQGTVTLSAPAPAGGAVVALSSSNASAATVPASVTIAAGASSAAFTATSRTVTSNTSVTITATYNGASRSAALTVTPSGGGPLPAPSLVSPASDATFSPGQSITFDWGDVAGAATYTIQIDDQDTFPSPIVNQAVTSSQFTTSTLPTTRMWFRVRANDASGNAGAWCAARRFEVKS